MVIIPPWTWSRGESSQIDEGPDLQIEGGKVQNKSEDFCISENVD
jgi:hypothetical protein